MLQRLGWVVVGFGLVSASVGAGAQDSRGRKYKVPPPTSHLEVLVLKDTNKKPLVNAAVIFHASKDGHDEGNLEVKTNDQGKATIDVIETGSSVVVQVIADGFATYAETYQVNEASREIEVRMIKPRAQISTYVDTHGQAATRTVGVQEQTTPKLDPTLDSKGDGKAPAKVVVPAVNTNPPNVHPDNQYPVTPATPPPGSGE